MSRATIARGLRALASLVAGDDPAGLAIAEAVRARVEAGDAVELARRALAASERAAEDDAVTMSIALRTRGVVGYVLRGGIARAEAGLPSVAAVGPSLAAAARSRAEAASLPAVMVADARALLADLGDDES